MDCAKLIAFGIYHTVLEICKNARKSIWIGKLSAATIGDSTPVSYHMGISVIRDVLSAVEILKQRLEDLTACGTIFYGASISTSGRLGLGKEENYAYDIYEVEFLSEILFGVAYRKSLTTIFPRFLKAMSVYHEEDISRYFKDAFGFAGNIQDSVEFFALRKGNYRCYKELSA